jgi:hypothetical protein
MRANNRSSLNRADSVAGAGAIRKGSMRGNKDDIGMRVAFSERPDSWEDQLKEGIAPLGICANFAATTDYM